MSDTHETTQTEDEKNAEEAAAKAREEALAAQDAELARAAETPVVEPVTEVPVEPAPVREPAQLDSPEAIKAWVREEIELARAGMSVEMRMVENP